MVWYLQLLLVIVSVAFLRSEPRINQDHISQSQILDRTTLEGQVPQEQREQFYFQTKDT
jgi:hypothetical protein